MHSFPREARVSMNRPDHWAGLDESSVLHLGIYWRF
jgi:hypothetical protein